ncbi:MAG: GIY-YIG nuclease family protein [Candidatus Thiodiazotropha endolucinida]
MNKQKILDEIVRTAKENEGIPLGVGRFETETGIRESDWRGIIWARWGDALKEAGYEPNKLQDAYPEEFVLSCLEEVVKHFGRYPTIAELKLFRKSNPDFPTHNVFQRLGRKGELAKLLFEFTNDARVREICEPLCASEDINEDTGEQVREGFVYLMKSGRYYKIGFTNSVDRRQYELGMQLPEGIKPIHSIRTDDPSGIEAYWHNRFRAKRMKGEWFDLSRKEIAAFKKRKYM